MTKEIIDILENIASGGYEDLTPLQAQTILDYIKEKESEE